MKLIKTNQRDEIEVEVHLSWNLFNLHLEKKINLLRWGPSHSNDNNEQVDNNKMALQRRCCFSFKFHRVSCTCSRLSPLTGKSLQRNKK